MQDRMPLSTRSDHASAPLNLPPFSVAAPAVPRAQTTHPKSSQPLWIPEPVTATDEVILAAPSTQMRLPGGFRVRSSRRNLARSFQVDTSMNNVDPIEGSVQTVSASTRHNRLAQTVPIGLSQCVLTKYAAKAPPHRLMVEDANGRLQRVVVDRISGHRLVPGREGEKSGHSPDALERYHACYLGKMKWFAPFPK